MVRLTGSKTCWAAVRSQSLEPPVLLISQPSVHLNPSGVVPLPAAKLSSDEDGDLPVRLSRGFHANLKVWTQIGQEFH